MLSRAAAGSLSLLPEVAALSQLALATGGHAQDGAAAAETGRRWVAFRCRMHADQARHRRATAASQHLLGAHDSSLGVGEHGGDLQAAGALDVHEVGVGGLNQALQLVLLLLGAHVRDGEVNDRHG